MSLENMTTSSFKILEPMVFELHPGGLYNLNEDNCVETAIVKLSLLSHFCDLAANSWSYSGENNLMFNKEIEALAEKIFTTYTPFFEAGLDISKYNEYYMPRQLETYLARPIVNGQFNATADESTDGFPEGWWYDFPGIAAKHFTFGKICIDTDEHVRIWLYANNDDDNQNPIDGVDITCDADYGKIFVKWPGSAVEIAAAAKRIWEIDQDNNNPQI